MVFVFIFVSGSGGGELAFKFQLCIPAITIGDYVRF